MIRFFNIKVFLFLDKPFKKLFDVIPQNLTREQTRAYLKVFTYKELPDVGQVKVDHFVRRGLQPTNVCTVHTIMKIKQ